jgi:hypothetical protein
MPMHKRYDYKDYVNNGANDWPVSPGPIRSLSANPAEGTWQIEITAEREGVKDLFLAVAYAI